MASNRTLRSGLIFIAIIILAAIVSLLGQSATTAPDKKSSYMPVVDKEDFSTTHDRMSAAKGFSWPFAPFQVCGLPAKRSLCRFPSASTADQV